MKNVFIVGATNQIGHFLLPILIDKYNIFALSRKENYHEKINHFPFSVVFSNDKCLGSNVPN